MPETQVLSCEFCEISKNTFLTKIPNLGKVPLTDLNRYNYSFTFLELPSN